MIIILEGPDATGKTTLAKAIAEKTGYPIFHEGPPVPGESLYRRYQRKLLECPSSCILDRGFHGELVYGPLVRGKSQIDPFQLVALELLAAARGVHMVWCSAKPEDIRFRLKDSTEKIDVMVREDPDAFLRAYDIIETMSKIPAGQYSSSFSQPGAWVRDHTFGGDVLTNPKYEGVGNTLRPDRILVGDELSNGVVPFDSGPAARFLFDAAKVNPRYDMLINSFHEELGPVQSHEHLKRALQFCRSAMVFALGEKALKRVRQAAPNRPIRYADHPQFRSRFHHHDKNYSRQFD